MNQSTAELIFCLNFLKNQPVPHVSVPPSSSPLPLLLALFAEAPLVLPPANAARAFAVQGEAKFHTPPHVYLLSYDVFPPLQPRSAPPSSPPHPAPPRPRPERALSTPLLAGVRCGSFPRCRRAPPSAPPAGAAGVGRAAGASFA
jgi:hypothetical protein